ncbi:hypothetical protein RIF29_12666 [Crotalaria pallida]|uniref:Uncharacterized protein n=1 Tax=Crotalaria pallida TaxID=3830 RepID=A0AAN9INI9_CROPI
MKVSAFCALFMVLGAALVFVTFSTPISGYLFPDLSVTNNSGETKTVIATRSRKLKENGSGMGSVNLEDYIPVKPLPPDAKAYVSGGTIEHGQPVGPYIPKPTPPPAW